MPDPAHSKSSRFTRDAPRILRSLLLLGLAAAGPPPRDQDRITEAPFLQENDAAMATMMSGMAIKPSGDVDRDFVAMMIPHHQGAIDMAVAELRHGRNEQLRRIAQEIIVDQQQEIAAMRLALGQPLPPSAPAPTAGVPGGTSDGATSSHRSPTNQDNPK